MKTKKKILVSIVILFASVFVIVFANGCYYVFWGQDKSAEKLAQGKDLNAYEIASIYSMHTACWMFGWPVSPEAAKLIFAKQFHIDNKYKIFCTGDMPSLRKSPVVQKAYEKVCKEADQGNFDVKVQLYWKDYSEDIRAALALNGGYLTMSAVDVYGETWAIPTYIAPTDYKPGVIYIKGIKIHETLFDYLENIGILSNPTFHLRY